MSSDFKDLIAWQRAMELVVSVYRMTRSFPIDERFGLTNQLRRAAVSIPSNIAEGQGRLADGDFIRFLKIANGSRQEVETQLRIACTLEFVTAVDLEPVTAQIEEVARLIFGLIRSLS